MDVFVRERDALVAAAVFAAHEIGLYAAPPLPVPELAARLGVGARRLRALVDVLRHEGWPATRPPRPAAPPPHGVGRLAEVLRNDAPLPGPVPAPPHPARPHPPLRRGAPAPAAAVRPARGPARALLAAGGAAGGYTAASLRGRPDARAPLVDPPGVAPLARETPARHA